MEEVAGVFHERSVNIRSNKISSENIYLFLQLYGIIYDNFTGAEKKELMKVSIEKVKIHKESLPNKINGGYVNEKRNTGVNNDRYDALPLCMQ